MDIYEKISQSLPVADVIKLCSASKEHITMTNTLLKNRAHEIQSAKSSMRWCDVCNSTVTIDNFYVLFVCTCQGDSYPYYHLQCIGKQSNEKGYGIEKCPKCSRRKPMIVCDNAS